MIDKNLIREQKKLRIFQIKNLGRIKEEKEKYKLPIEVRARKIGNKKNFKIFLVDGYKIRQFIDFDFTMGGHGLRYVYIPLDEIWVDFSNRNEKEEIIVHEIVEFELMKKGINYEKAHKLASLKELELRNRKIILPVGHRRQITSWSCGPSALKIVLDYYGNKRNINYLIRETSCNKDGTLHKGFRKLLEKLGYKFFEKKNAKIENIEKFIQKGALVIVDYQAYHGGHFSVVIGYDEKRFLFSDPAYSKKFKWLDKKNFEKRWWDEDKPGKIIKRWLIAVYR